MATIQKSYEQYFVLEPTKVSRIVDKIHERFDDLKLASHDSFTVFLSQKRREELTRVEDVLSLDNSASQKIQRLLIVNADLKLTHFPS